MACIHQRVYIYFQKKTQRRINNSGQVKPIQKTVEQCASLSYIKGWEIASALCHVWNLKPVFLFTTVALHFLMIFMNSLLISIHSQFSAFQLHSSTIYNRWERKMFQFSTHSLACNNKKKQLLLIDWSNLNYIYANERWWTFSILFFCERHWIMEDGN